MANENSEDDEKTIVDEVKAASHEIQTKAIYIAAAGVYALSEAGVFSFDIPSQAFAALFIVVVMIDAYR